MSPSIIKSADGSVLYEAPYASTLRDALVQAVASGANLTGANLTGANLIGANLTRANLTGANLTGANLTGANLTRANLTGANLIGANLTWANLIGANLTRANLTGATRLPTGETWDEYIREVLPALLVAGGKELAAVANERTWGCHAWRSGDVCCPMAEAFDADDITGVPILLHPRVDQFIQFFDGGLIPLATVLGGTS